MTSSYILRLYANGRGISLSTDTATDDSRSPDMGKDTATADKAKKTKKPSSEKKAAKMREEKIAEEILKKKKYHF